MAARHVITKATSVSPGAGKAFTVEDRKIALFNVDGHFYAIDDVCSHDHASLAEGQLDGKIIVCPWHAAEFDVTNGEVMCPPATENVRSYPVFVNGDSIEVEF